MDLSLGMSDAIKLAEKVHAASGGVFAFGWMMLFLFSGRLLGGVLPIWYIFGGGAAATLLAVLGLHPGEKYFSVRAPEQWVKLCRWGGIVPLKGLMVHGDRMNAWVRARFPDYRVLRSDAIPDYISRTRDMERVHLACLLASLVVVTLAAVGRLWPLAGSISLLTLLTNVLPIVLQRFNRARCQLLLRKRDHRA